MPPVNFFLKNSGCWEHWQGRYAGRWLSSAWSHIKMFGIVTRAAHIFRESMPSSQKYWMRGCKSLRGRSCEASLAHRFEGLVCQLNASLGVQDTEKAPALLLEVVLDTLVVDSCRNAGMDKKPQVNVFYSSLLTTSKALSKASRMCLFTRALMPSKPPS